MGDHYEYDYPYNHELALTDRLNSYRNCATQYRSTRMTDGALFRARLGMDFPPLLARTKQQN